MKISNEELILLSHTAIRCLIAKGLLSVDELMADFARRKVPEEIALRLRTFLAECSPT